MLNLLLAFLTALIISTAIMPAVIRVAKKLRVRQTVLGYVDNHAAKSGTPTMGGLGFVLACTVAAFAFFRGESTLAIMLAAMTAGFGAIGFIDDFIKVRFRQNKGLTPLQKAVFQLLVAAIVSWFVYNSPYVGDKLYVPFTMDTIELGAFALPYYAFVFVAMVNAVNLTDGLDGLAGKTSLVYLAAFTALIAVAAGVVGGIDAQLAEQRNLMVFSVSLIGALSGFLLYNSYPASVFMGDTGALALGGALAGLAVMSGMSLLAPIVGVMFVLSCVSDLIQVAHYKRTKRRVFLMAPFHHHLERKGMHENKIVALYTLITAVTGAVTVAVTLAAAAG